MKSLGKWFAGFVAIAVAGFAAVAAASDQAESRTSPAGIVSNIKILSDKVPDVSSLDAWKKSFIKAGMSDKEKALAIFKTEVMFQQADQPPEEYLQRENPVLDPIKLFNVYGYTLCSVSTTNMVALAHSVGLKARSRTVQNHVVPEIYYDDAWHMLDADLIEYYPKADGSIASVDELVAGVSAWRKEHPDVAKLDRSKRYAYMRTPGWKTGPDILIRNPYYDENGWLPCADFSWGDTIAQFAGVVNDWQSCFSTGYRVNVQLREGERLTRNWFNKGLYVNMDHAPHPDSLTAKIGQGTFRQAPHWGDIAPGRVGNGTVEYDVPLASGAFRGGALAAKNLAAKSEDSRGPAVHVKNPDSPGVLEIRMPSSYVYMGGRLNFTPVVGEGGGVQVFLSDNNGLDWKPLVDVASAGEQAIDLKPHIFRRYDFTLRFVMKGKETGLDALKIAADFEHSQRPLPALAKGENKIAFSSGPQEGTITIEGAMEPSSKGKQLLFTDFHPQLDGYKLGEWPKGEGDRSITFPVKTPGDMTRLRISDFFLSYGKDSFYYIDVSFDGGTTWQTVDRPNEPSPPGRYVDRAVVVSDVPAGTQSAEVRFRGVGRNTLAMSNARIDADYKEPAGGFRPVQVTYVWQEGGEVKKDVHIARRPQETYTITCQSRPVMKSLVVELAK